MARWLATGNYRVIYVFALDNVEYSIKIIRKTVDKGIYVKELSFSYVRENIYH